MELFKSHASRKADHVKSLDWSSQILDSKIRLESCHIQDLVLPGEVTALAYDPLQSLLAAATQAGSIHVWGSSGVHLSWTERPAHAIKHLAFKSGTPFIISIDDKDTVFIHDLSNVDKDRPHRDFAQIVRMGVTCLEVNPAHSHAFIGARDGTVTCLDVDRAALAPYRIKNHWLEQERMLRRSGVPGAPHVGHVPSCNDIKCHPRDIGQLLIAYDGGIALFSLVTDTVIKTYDLVILPGASGGCPDPATIFSERRPLVTCLAWHPDGLCFVAGHEDGCLSFWDVKDGDKPLQCRTLDNNDVLAFQWNDTSDTAENDKQANALMREPIFKIAWASYSGERTLSVSEGSAAGVEPSQSPIQADTKSPHSRSFGTSICILGGLLPTDPMGVHVLHFPSLVMPTAWNPSAVDLRNSITASLTPISHSVYQVQSLTDDFLLLPKASPFFAGALDPFVIMIIARSSPNLPDMAHSSERNTTAYTFPPEIHSETKELLVTPMLQFGADGAICTSKMVDILDVEYGILTEPPQSTSQTHNNLVLHGGRAVNAASLSRNEAFRLWIVGHRNLSVTFWDVSPSLFNPSKGHPHQDTTSDSKGARLNTDFPRGLPHLTIDKKQILEALELCGANVQRTKDIWIQDLCWSGTTTELLVLLNTGESIVFSFNPPKAVPKQDPSGESSLNEVNQEDHELSDALKKANIAESQNPPTETKHQSTGPHVRAKNCLSDSDGTQIFDLRPFFSKLPGCFRAGTVIREPGLVPTSVAISSVGFIALAFGDVLTIVNLKTNEILFQEALGSSHGRATPPDVRIMKFSIGYVGDQDVCPYLLVGLSNGQFDAISFTYGLGTWVVKYDTSLSHQHDSHVDPINLISLDTGGREQTASPEELKLALVDKGYKRQIDAPFTITIIISANAVSTRPDFNGATVAKINFEDKVVDASVIHTPRGLVLAVVDEKRVVFFFTLPNLSLLKRCHLPIVEGFDLTGTLCIHSSGDFIESISPMNITFGSLIESRHNIFETNVTTHETAIVLPTIPTMRDGVSNKFAAWWGGQAALVSPDQIDTKLGGPDRPERKQTRRKPANVLAVPKSVGDRRREALSESEATKGPLAQTSSALNERGERLGFLDERLNDMTSAANDLATQARRIAREQGAKTALSGGIGGFKSLFK